MQMATSATTTDMPLSEGQTSPVPPEVPSTNDTDREHPAQRESSKPTDEPEYLKGGRLYALILALLLTVLIVTLDLTILATAIPYITNDFHTIKDIGWYGAAYLLTSSSLQPLSGRLYTYFPLKPAYLTFIAIFAVGSLVCATAPTSAALVIGRAVAGIGASGLINGAMTIIGIEGPPSQQAILLGILFSLSGLGQIMGPLIGGGLTQHASWRWCFYINLPPTAATAASIFFIRFTGRQTRKIDWTWKALLNGLDLVGFSLFAPACVMLLLALEWGGVTYAWNSAIVIGLLCGSGACAIIFVFWERHHNENAMFPITLIRRRVIAAACVTGFFQGGGMIMLSYYLPLWLQVVKHVSPTGSAVRTLPIFLSQVISTIISAVLLNKILYLAPFALLGNTLSTLGTGLMSTFTPHTPAGQWIGYQILVGAGRGLGMQQPFLAAQAHAPPKQLPVASAIVTFTQLMGGSIFVALGQTAFANLLRRGLVTDAPGVDPDVVIRAGATDYTARIAPGERAGVLRAYNWAITRTFLLAVGATAAAAVTSLALGRARAKGKGKGKGKTENKAKDGEEKEQEEKGKGGETVGGSEEEKGKV